MENKDNGKHREFTDKLGGKEHIISLMKCVRRKKLKPNEKPNGKTPATKIWIHKRLA